MSTNTTIELVSLALDASLMRQTAIAHNVANSNSTNYRPIEVNFEQQLTQGATHDLPAIQPFYQMSDQHASIDEQMIQNVKNMTHYRALIKGLNQHFAILQLALQGNSSS